MAACFANGNKVMLKQLQAAQLVADTALIVKILESSGDPRFKAEDLLDLSTAYDNDDSVGFTVAMRRLAGDETAGTDDDELREFHGTLVDFDPVTRRFKKMQTQEEEHRAYQMNVNAVNCWRRTEVLTYLAVPSLVPQIHKPEHSAWHEAVCIGTSQMTKNAETWEACHQHNLVHYNIANAMADAVQGMVSKDFAGFVNWDGQGMNMGTN